MGKRLWAIVLTAALLTGSVSTAAADEGVAAGTIAADQAQQLPLTTAADGLAGAGSTMSDYEGPGAVKFATPDGYKVYDTQAYIQKMVEEGAYASVGYLPYNALNGTFEFGSAIEWDPDGRYRIVLAVSLRSTNGGENLYYVDEAVLSYEELADKRSWEVSSSAVKVRLNRDELQDYQNFDLAYAMFKEGSRNIYFRHPDGYTLFTAPRQLDYAWSALKAGVGYIQRNSIRVNEAMTLRFAEQDLVHDAVSMQLPVAGAFEFQVNTEGAYFRFPIGTKKIRAVRGAYQVSMDEQLEEQTVHWHSDSRTVLEDTAYLFGEPEMQFERLSASAGEVYGYTPVRRGDFELGDVSGRNLAERFHTEYVLRDAAGRIVSSQELSDPEDYRFQYAERFEPPLPSGTYQLTATVTFPGFTESLTAVRAFEVAVMDSDMLNGTMVRAENEAGNPLQAGQLLVYEKRTVGAAGTSSIGYAPVYRTGVVEPGAFFVPNAYLLAGRQYELVVTGSSESPMSRVIYHRSITAGEGDIVLRGEQLTRVTFSSANADGNDALLLSIIGGDDAQTSWPILLPFDGSGRAVVYAQTSQRVKAIANLYDEQSDTGYYLEREAHLRGAKQLNVTLEGDMVRLTPPANADDAAIKVVSSRYLNGVEAAVYKVNKGSSATAYYSVTNGEYRYTFKSDAFDIQQDIRYAVGERDNRLDSQGTLQAGGVNQKVYTDYYDEQQQRANLYAVSRIGGAPPGIAANGGIQFEAAVGSDTQLMTVSETKEGLLAYQATALSAGSSAWSAGLTPVLEYRLYDANNVQVGEPIFASSFESAYVQAPDIPGAYTLKLVNQLFPDDLKSYRGQVRLVNEYANSGKRIPLVGTDEYPVVVNWNGGVEIRSPGEETIYGGIDENDLVIRDFEQIQADKTYTLHLYGLLASRTGQRIQYYTRHTLKGGELLKLGSIKVGEGNRLGSSDMADWDAFNQVMKMEVVIPAHGADAAFAFAADERRDIITNVPRIAWYIGARGAISTEAYGLYKEAVWNSASGKFDVANKPLHSVKLQNGKSFVNFDVERYERPRIGISSYDPRKLFNQLRVTPGTQRLKFETIRIDANESPWLYSWRSEEMDIQRDETLPFYGTVVEEASSLQIAQSYEAGKGYYLTISPKLMSGGLQVESITVMREYMRFPTGPLGGARAAAQTTYPYEGEFYAYSSVFGTLTVKDAQGAIVYEDSGFAISGDEKLGTALPAGSYLVEMSIPTGPNEQTKLRQSVTVNAGGNQGGIGGNPGGGAGGGGGMGGIGGGAGGSAALPGGQTEASSLAKTIEFTESALPAPVDKWLRLSAGGAETVKFPASVTRRSDIVGVAIRAAGVEVPIPMAVIKQLVALLPAGQEEGAVVTLDIKLISAEDVLRRIAGGGVEFAVAGAAYELSLSVTGKDGKMIFLRNFDEPISLSLQVNSDVNPDLTNVYYIADNGTVAYKKGRRNGDALIAEVRHFSLYGVLTWKKTFADVSAKHWAYGVIQQLAARQIVQGVSDNAFAPEKKLTRAEFIAMVAKALDLKASGAAPFSDVASSAWYADEAAAAYEAGLVRGDQAKRFRPLSPITREEMVVILVKALERSNIPNEADETAAAFKDQNRISGWAKDAARVAVRAGLINGDAEGRLRPQGLASRAEAVQMVRNLLGRLER
ncbi:S-layer homology domain-containing protein [Paenibacillus aurantiacus]|uniref:S-layer homology domain-containing protein n=1 Tax=Paenibacillus aurantiacus TaxID=1936118 RepID=A0ABV5KL57_9BACL